MARAAAVLCSLVCVGVALPADASASAPPPALQTLEARMQGIQLTSERFSASAVASSEDRRLLARLLKVWPLDFSFEGVATLAPAAAALTIDVRGHTVRLRFVGGQRYMYSYELARRDGGRPWVRLAPGPVYGLRLTEEAPVASADAAQPFDQLIEQLNGATQHRELGPSAIDGQPASGFAQIVDEHAFAEQLLPGLGSPIDGSGEAGGLLEVFLGADGLPLRVRTQTAEGSVRYTVTENLLGVNFPLVVEAPPASETIGQGALQRLLAHPHRHRRRHRRRSKK
ncbi:MAG TPA: hypothetical protein VGG08_08005 [Solirubrobacteraceae bacterium]